MVGPFAAIAHGDVVDILTLSNRAVEPVLTLDPEGWKCSSTSPLQGSTPVPLWNLSETQLELSRGRGTKRKFSDPRFVSQNSLVVCDESGHMKFPVSLIVLSWGELRLICPELSLILP